MKIALPNITGSLSSISFFLFIVIYSYIILCTYTVYIIYLLLMFVRYFGSIYLMYFYKLFWFAIPFPFVQAAWSLYIFINEDEKKKWVNEVFIDTDERADQLLLISTGIM